MSQSQYCRPNDTVSPGCRRNAARHLSSEAYGENEDWLWDVANGMETEDGLIWVYGIGEDGVMAFTNFGIENLMELIRMHKEDPELLKRWDG